MFVVIGSLAGAGAEVLPYLGSKPLPHQGFSTHTRWPGVRRRTCLEANPPPGQGADDSWAHALMRQLGQESGPGIVLSRQMVPARTGGPSFL